MLTGLLLLLLNERLVAGIVSSVRVLGRRRREGRRLGGRVCSTRSLHVPWHISSRIRRGHAVL